MWSEKIVTSLLILYFVPGMSMKKTDEHYANVLTCDYELRGNGIQN